MEIANVLFASEYLETILRGMARNIIYNRMIIIVGTK